MYNTNCAYHCIAVLLYCCIAVLCVCAWVEHSRVIRPLLSVLRKQKQCYCFRFWTEFCLLSRAEKQKQISKLSLDDDLNNSGSFFCTGTNRTKLICQQTLFQHSLDNLPLGQTRLRPGQQELDSFRKLSLLSLRTSNITQRTSSTIQSCQPSQANLSEGNVMELTLQRAIQIAMSNYTTISSALRISWRFWTKQKIRSQLSKPGKRGATADGTTVHGATYYLISHIEIHFITMGKHFGGDSECHVLFSKKLFSCVKRPKVLRMTVLTGFLGVVRTAAIKARYLYPC